MPIADGRAGDSRGPPADRDRPGQAASRHPQASARLRVLHAGRRHRPVAQANLHTIVSKYFDLRRLRPDSEQARKASLLADVRAFETASLAGDYYESFDVNSKNFMEKSRGTTGWIAEWRRLLDRCVEQAKTADAGEVCQAFGIIFGLLDRIDECREDFIFFADEAGGLAGRGPLGEGAAAVVQSPVGDGRT